MKIFLNVYGAVCIAMFLLHTGLKRYEKRKGIVSPHVHEIIHGLGHLVRILLVLLMLYLALKSAGVASPTA